MKAKKIMRYVFTGITLFLIMVLLALQIGVTVRYWDYFTNSSVEFRIPGLWDDFVPQGFHYMKDRNVYLVSGYMSNDDASRVYIRDGRGNVTFASLYDGDLKPYTGHAGGVCTDGKFVYLPGDSGVDVFLLKDIFGGKAQQIGTIPTGFRTDFCSFYDGYLLMGSFEYAGYYETPEEHKITTPAGDKNTALIVAFAADGEGEFGVNASAVAAFSVTDRVQGMCVTDLGQIVLSTSWGFNDSHLYFYDVDTQRAGTVQLLTGEVPLYYLDSSNLTKTVAMPPMSEELIVKDGRVWVMCESACNKYIYGRLIRGNRVYGYPTDYLYGEE